MGARSKPSPETLSSTGQRTWWTAYASVSATSAGLSSSPNRSIPTETRESTTPMILRKRSRLGSTDFSYAACDERSRFQYFRRASTDSTMMRSTYLCAPSIIRSARSPSQVRGCVPGILRIGCGGVACKRSFAAIVNPILCNKSRLVILGGLQYDCGFASSLFTTGCMHAACRLQFKLQSSLLRSGPQVSPLFSTIEETVLNVAHE